MTKVSSSFCNFCHMVVSFCCNRNSYGNTWRCNVTEAAAEEADCDELVVAVVVGDSNHFVQMSQLEMINM